MTERSRPGRDGGPATDWDARYAGDDLLWSERPNRFVVEQLEAVPPGEAIDLGAGEGRNSIWLATRGWRVTAVDSSAAGLARGRARAGAAGVTERVTFELGDALRWTPTAPVDLVLLAYLQLPTDEQRHVLARAAGWVAPGGRLVVVAHDERNVDHGYGGPPVAAVCYDVDRTVAAISDLRVEQASIVEREVSTPEGLRTALDTLVIATRPTAPGPDPP